MKLGLRQPQYASMQRIVSDRAEKTDQVVIMPSALEDSTKAPPGTYRIFLVALLGSIFFFFASLVIAYILRAQAHPYWDPIMLPRILWFSTMLIVFSSVTFEFARRAFRWGRSRLANNFLLVTATLGMAFLACQLTAWRDLVHQGAYLMNNPHGSFFYLFTGLHALHLVGGLIMLFVVLWGRNKRRELFNVVCYYWHFLGVLWIALFEVLRVVS
jgi:cytochrome c oxidase subunit III